MLRLFEEWNQTLLSLTQAPVRSRVEDLRPFQGLRKPAAVHPPVEAARLQWQLKLRGEAVEERFRFRSPLHSGDSRNDHVKGQRWRRHEARLSGTALLMLHAAFAPNHRPERLYSRSALGRGAHVFVISLPYHICRRPILQGPPQLERGRIEVVYGTQDMIVPEDAVLALLHAWGEPPARSLQTGHRLIATRAPQLRQRLGEWVEERRTPPATGLPQRKSRA